MTRTCYLSARSRQVDDAVVARCQSWIAEHYDEPAPVAAMVRLSGLPEHSFKRRFQQATTMMLHMKQHGEDPTDGLFQLADDFFVPLPR